MFYNGERGDDSPTVNTTSHGMAIEANWSLERVVSIVVPVFFGIIGVCGLLGNALVIIGTAII